MRKQSQSPHDLLFGRNVTYCEEAEGESRKQQLAVSSPSKINQHDDDESCNVCLYTGVATCTGLASYFWKMGILDMPERSSSKFTQEMARQQRFLVTFGGAWALAGAYRWYLG